MYFIICDKKKKTILTFTLSNKLCRLRYYAVKKKNTVFSGTYLMLNIMGRILVKEIKNHFKIEFCSLINIYYDTNIIGMIK